MLSRPAFTSTADLSERPSESLQLIRSGRECRLRMVGFIDDSVACDKGRNPARLTPEPGRTRASWPTDSFPKRNKLACPSKGGRLRGGLENDTGNQKDLGLDRCCLGGHNRRVSNTLGCWSWAKTTSNNVVESGLRPRAHSSGYAWPGAPPQIRCSLSGCSSSLVRRWRPGGRPHCPRKTERARRRFARRAIRARTRVHVLLAARPAGPWLPRSERLPGSPRPDAPFVTRSFLPASDLPQD